MCTLVVGLLSAGLGAVQAIAQHQQKQAEYRASLARYDQNYQNALASGRDEQKQLQQRELQEQKAYQQKDQAQVVEGAKRAAEGSVQAAASGITGLSVDAIVADIHRTTNGNRATLETNYQGTAQQLQAEMDGTTTKTTNRINNVPEPIAPSPVGMLVGIAGAGLRAYGAADSAGAFGTSGE